MSVSRDKGSIADFAVTVDVGDEVGVYEQLDRMIYKDIVKRITPTGRIVLEMGSVFKSDGMRYGGGVYWNRHIWKVQEDSHRVVD